MGRPKWVLPTPKSWSKVAGGRIHGSFLGGTEGTCRGGKTCYPVVRKEPRSYGYPFSPKIFPSKWGAKESFFEFPKQIIAGWNCDVPAGKLTVSYGKWRIYYFFYPFNLVTFNSYGKLIGESSNSMGDFPVIEIWGTYGFIVWKKNVAMGIAKKT